MAVKKPSKGIRGKGPKTRIIDLMIGALKTERGFCDGKATKYCPHGSACPPPTVIPTCCTADTESPDPNCTETCPQCLTGPLGLLMELLQAHITVLSPNRAQKKKPAKKSALKKKRAKTAKRAKRKE